MAVAVVAVALVLVGVCVVLTAVTIATAVAVCSAVVVIIKIFIMVITIMFMSGMKSASLKIINSYIENKINLYYKLISYLVLDSFLLWNPLYKRTDTY